MFLDAKGRRPTMKVTQNGIEKEMPKYPLDPKDIIVLKFGMIEAIDFPEVAVGLMASCQLSVVSCQLGIRHFGHWDGINGPVGRGHWLSQWHTKRCKP